MIHNLILAAPLIYIVVSLPIQTARLVIKLTEYAILAAMQVALSECLLTCKITKLEHKA